MYNILEESKAVQLINDADVIHDGLIAFASQGQHAIEIICYEVNDEESAIELVFQVDMYDATAKNEEDPLHLTELAQFNHRTDFESYFELSNTFYFTDRAEAMLYFAQYLAQKNHF